MMKPNTLNDYAALLAKQRTDKLPILQTLRNEIPRSPRGEPYPDTLAHALWAIALYDPDDAVRKSCVYALVELATWFPEKRETTLSFIDTLLRQDDPTLATAIAEAMENAELPYEIIRSVLAQLPTRS